MLALTAAYSPAATRLAILSGGDERHLRLAVAVIPVIEDHQSPSGV